MCKCTFYKNWLELLIAFRIKKQLREMEIQKKLEEEMNAQKLMAYTGEELHRLNAYNHPFPCF